MTLSPLSLQLFAECQEAVKPGSVRRFAANSTCHLPIKDGRHFLSDLYQENGDVVGLGHHVFSAPGVKLETVVANTQGGDTCPSKGRVALEEKPFNFSAVLSHQAGVTLLFLDSLHKLFYLFW